jgi:hypothetical protein
MDDYYCSCLSILRGMWYIAAGSAWRSRAGPRSSVSRSASDSRAYEATARVYVDTQSPDAAADGGTCDPAEPGSSRSPSSAARSYRGPTSRKLVRMADLDLGPVTSHPAKRRSIARPHLQLSGNVQTNLYQISYRDLRTASRRARSCSRCSRSSVESRPRRQAPGPPVRRQVRRRADQALRESSRRRRIRLKDFSLKYLGIAGLGGPDYFGRPHKIATTSRARAVELPAAEQSRDSYRRELVGETPTLMPGYRQPSSSHFGTSGHRSRLATLAPDLDAMLRK